MDIIYINDLRIEAVIGVYVWERQLKQVVIFDIELGTDIRKAALTDSVADTLNYKDVAKRVMAFVTGSRYQLVESLAEAVAELIIKEFDIPWLRLRLNKQGAVRGVRDVGVIIERGRREEAWHGSM
ncbi:MAG: dihydroneopterin aldolase [Gammaproteobacteria bacterium]|nr:dihydroneopterin aldolase [Gammaproteobacteria bacterium]